MKIDPATPNTPEAKAAVLFNTLKRWINSLPLTMQMKVASVDDFDRLPDQAQKVIAAAVEELEL